MSITFQNSTPWRTEDLEALIAPGLVGTAIEIVDISLLRASPGRGNNEQPHAHVSLAHMNEKLLEIEIISPKRCAKRADPLSRLSLVTALQPHETLLTDQAVGIIAHALQTMREGRARHSANGATWAYAQHISGQCACLKYKSDTAPYVRGDAKARTHKGPTVERMEHNLSWREKRLAQWLEKAAEEQAALEKLRVRIAKKHEKAMIRPKDRIAV